MGLPSISTSRPITFLMIYIAVVSIGLVSVAGIKIDLYPDIDLPTLTVITSYEGVAPEDIETLITRPIEEAVASVEDVDQVTSTSREGLSIVTVKFKWGKDMDVASLDVREAIDRVRGFLPQEADEPFVFKFSTSAMPILFLAVSGEQSLSDLRRISQDEIEPRLERVKGVAAAYTQGGREREIHVYADDRRLKTYGLTLDHLIYALRMQNMNLPGGSIEQGRSDFLLRTTGEFKSVSEIESIVIARYNGEPVRLRDVARVEDTVADRAEDLRINGKPAVMVMIQKQSNANTVEVCDRVKAQLPAIEKLLEVRFGVIMDSSRYIKQSINNLKSVAFEGAILAIIVLLLFLRNIPSTLIIATSIPVSVIATFIAMRFANVTLNMISMGGLALGIGMLVDSSIVVLENIYRHRERGLTRREAAVYGAAEVSNAVTASVLTTIAVFFPVVFVPGIAGIMFRDMALTVVFSLTCSLLVALTLVPLLSSRLLRLRRKQNLPSADHLPAADPESPAKQGLLERMVRWALRNKLLTLVLAGAVLVISVLSLLWFVGVEFVPMSQPGEFRVFVEMPVGTRLDITNKAVDRIEKIVLENVPEVETMFSRVGQGSGFGAMFGRSGSHQGRVWFQVVPLNKRKRTDIEIREALRPQIRQVPGATAYFGEEQFFEAMFGGSRLAVEIYGYDLDVGRNLADEVKKIMESISGTVEVRISREEGNPESRIVVDKEKAARYGLTVSDVAYAIRAAIQGSIAGKYREGGKEYNIRVRLPEERRISLDDVMDTLIPTPSGNSIPLAAVARMEVMSGPVEIERKGQQRVVTVTGNLTGERDLGSIVSELSKKLARLKTPPDFIVQVAGEAKEINESFRWLGIAFIGAVFLVYMVMASQFESLLHPFVVMFSLPLSFIGVSLMLLATKTTLSINSLIGVIMLAGIVVNNAILLVDYTNLLRARGLGLEEAVITAAKTRRRPVLMTALTTILAMIPMGLGLGEGSELNAPLARAVIGGLATSTVLTLVIIPVIYTIFVQVAERAKVKSKSEVR
ncbi:MAG: efflux RND transporter permease subunit [bacterium]